MTVLGIDPGTRRIGYALVRQERNDLLLLEAGLLRLEIQNDQEPFGAVKREIEAAIQKWHPAVLAVEKLYFSKNRKTAIAVAQMRGVILLAASEGKLKIQEYAPSEVKLGIAGYGNADKKAVAKMVKYFVRRPDLDVVDDVSDAIALAILGARGG